MSDPIYIMFLQLARDTAVNMMNNALYIQKELPGIDVPDDLRSKIEEVCKSLINTKHDVLHELFGYSREQGESTTFGELILYDLSEPVGEMHPLVMELQSLSEKDKRYSLAFILIAESSINILTVFQQAEAAFSVWRDKESNTENAGDNKWKQLHKKEMTRNNVLTENNFV